MFIKLAAAAIAAGAVAAAAPAAEAGVYVATTSRYVRTPVVGNVVHSVSWLRHPEVFPAGSHFAAGLAVTCRYRKRARGPVFLYRYGRSADAVTAPGRPARIVLTLRVPRFRGACWVFADAWSAALVKPSATIGPSLRVAIFYVPRLRRR
jgi:hypothetical protein